jgi:predicted nucleic acid-binding protein
LWQQSARREIALVSSELTLLETLVGPIKAGDREMAKDYERLLTATEFRLLAITARELKLAAWLRANAGIKTPDAIHAATALLVACDAFVSNDADFRRIDDLPLRLLREP